MISPWLVSRRFDLACFLAPALVALGLVAIEPVVAPDGDTPTFFWLLAVVFVDVGHVWSTIYRTYLNPEELRRRPVLYTMVPLAAWMSGVFLYSISALAFWRCLAYLAVFHFVRQQTGWVALYGRKTNDHPLDRRIDVFTVWMACGFPLAYWHAHLPRGFSWFISGDFIHGLVTPAVVGAMYPLYVATLAGFVARQIHRWRTEGVVAWGKINIVATTAACWGIGIVSTNSDFAFTITNVLIHGVPYVAVIWVFGRRAQHRPGTLLGHVFHHGRWGLFVVSLLVLGFFEEGLWDRFIWHEHGRIFPGPSMDVGRALERLLVPLLALPQAAHYLLDAFIWKTNPAKNPNLSSVMHLEGRTA